MVLGMREGIFFYSGLGLKSWSGNFEIHFLMFFLSMLCRLKWCHSWSWNSAILRSQTSTNFSQTEARLWTNGLLVDRHFKSGQIVSSTKHAKVRRSSASSSLLQWSFTKCKIQCRTPRFSWAQNLTTCASQMSATLHFRAREKVW